MSLVSQLIQNAQKVVDSRPASGSSGGFGYRTVYITPNKGAYLNVRMLVPQSSPVIAHKYWIHQGDRQRALCTYSDTHQVCEVCDKVREVENVTGTTPKLASRVRVIMYAQYVSSSGYDWSEDFPEPEQGDIIIVMGPGGLYHLASQFLIGFVDRPDMVSEFVADNEGQLVKLSRDKDRRTVMTPAMMKWRSANSQEEFEKLLEGLKPLDQLVQDAHPFDVHEATRKEMVQELTRRLGVGTPAPTVGQMEESGGPATQYTQPQPVQEQPVQIPPNYTEPTTVVQSPVNQPVQSAPSDPLPETFNQPVQQPTHLYETPAVQGGQTQQHTETQYQYPPQGAPTGQVQPAQVTHAPPQPQVTHAPPQPQGGVQHSAPQGATTGGDWGAGDPNQALQGFSQSHESSETSEDTGPKPPIAGTFGQHNQ